MASNSELIVRIQEAIISSFELQLQCGRFYGSWCRSVVARWHGLMGKSHLCGATEGTPLCSETFATNIFFMAN